MTAPLTKIKNAGVYKTVVGLETKLGGVWTKIGKGQVNDNGVWKTFFKIKTVVTLDQNAENINLDTHPLLTTNNGVAFLGDVDVIIDGDVFIYSADTSIPAFRTGTKIEGTLKLIFNDGQIRGAGGAGGAGNRGFNNGYAGSPGGIGLFLEKDVTIDNNNSGSFAHVLGGGGGGGGGSGGQNYHGGFRNENTFGSGGGGGGGVCFGSGASGGAGAGSGGNADLNSVGGGGSRTVDDGADGGVGGAGGVPGAAGSAGANTNSGGSVGGAGGAAGTAIKENGFTITAV